MPISKRVFSPRYVVLTSVVWLLVAVCPVLHGTQYSTLVLFSPHALFLDDIINYYSSKCHLYDDGSQLYAVLVPSTSLNSRIKSPATQMDISIWMSHRHLRFVMSQTRILYLFFSTATFSPLLPFLCHPSTYHVDVIITQMEHRFHLCPPLPHSYGKVIFQNVNHVIQSHCLFV